MILTLYTTHMHHALCLMYGLRSESVNLQAQVKHATVIYFVQNTVIKIA
jgi:hypothetical protein